MATGITDSVRHMEINKLLQIRKDYLGIINEYLTRIKSIEEELEEEYGHYVPTASDPLCQRKNRK